MGPVASWTSRRGKGTVVAPNEWTLLIKSSPIGGLPKSWGPPGFWTASWTDLTSLPRGSFLLTVNTLPFHNPSSSQLSTDSYPLEDLQSVHKLKARTLRGGINSNMTRKGTPSFSPLLFKHLTHLKWQLQWKHNVKFSLLSKLMEWPLCYNLYQHQGVGEVEVIFHLN